MLTPFEKNLEVWRQLWRVLERSDIVVQVLKKVQLLRSTSYGSRNGAGDVRRWGRLQPDVPCRGCKASASP